jgi:hypothetical protein
VYLVAQGQTLDCVAVPDAGLPAVSISDGAAVPQAYIDAMEAANPGRTAQLLAAGTLIQQ